MKSKSNQCCSRQIISRIAFLLSRIPSLLLSPVVKDLELAWWSPPLADLEENARAVDLWANTRPYPHRKRFSSPPVAAMSWIGREEEDEKRVDNLLGIVLYLIGEDRIGRSAPRLRLAVRTQVPMLAATAIITNVLII